ncbi:hypothetical protein [Bacillus sp. JCM 19034]|uniref:hypothetical protein n=1 Tax=Bacillus sp. JCM 19034 TaxID=1481928 RepID=UPI00078238F1|nr:hypothetical protein [Bacillus sp. JCM 19034]
MKNNISSTQTQNPIAQAQQSIEHAHHAIRQAQSHPSPELIEQAQNSLERAEHSVQQAANVDNDAAYELLREDLAQEVAALQEVKTQ